MNAQEIKALSTTELLALHNKLSKEKPTKRFSTRAAGERRVLALLVTTLKAVAEVARPAAEVKVKSATKKKDGTDKAKPGRVGFHSAQAVTGGKTVLQKESKRRKVFEAIAAATADEPISIDKLDKKLEFKSRPYCFKLWEGRHIKLFDFEGKALKAPVVTAEA